METNTLSISGPESAVNAVSRAVVDISLDNVTANVEIDATIRLLDADGNEITSSEIRKNVDSVKVTVPGDKGGHNQCFRYRRTGGWL